MAVYNESISGGAKIRGCGATIIYKRIYTTTYGAGDVVYNVYKARKGILERLVIKRVKTVNSAKTMGLFTVMYVDTFNALWNERDLVPYSTAKSLAEAYYLDQLEDIESIDAC